MNKSMYFLRNYGVYYTALCLLDSLYIKILKKTNKKVMRSRSKWVKDYLNRSYAEAVVGYYRKHNENIGKEKITKDCPLWVCWWQGVDKMPELAKVCVKRIREKACGHPVKLIDKDNIGQYLTFPKGIIETIGRGGYSIANFTDWVRAALLFQYGGIWLDATTWLAEDIDFVIDPQSTFFTVHHGMYADWHVCKGKWTIGYLACGKGNPVMGFVSDVLFRYLQNEDYCMYYLVTDCIISLAYDNVDVIRDEIDNVPLCNTAIFKMQKELDEIFNESIFAYNGDNAISKLSYKGKHKEKAEDGKLTNYGYIVSYGRY